MSLLWWNIHFTTAGILPCLSMIFQQISGFAFAFQWLVNVPIKHHPTTIGDKWCSKSPKKEISQPLLLLHREKKNSLSLSLSVHLQLYHHIRRAVILILILSGGPRFASQGNRAFGVDSELGRCKIWCRYVTRAIWALRTNHSFSLKPAAGWNSPAKPLATPIADLHAKSQSNSP